MSPLDIAPLINAAMAIGTPLVLAVFGSWAASHMKDQAAAAVINTTLANGLGVMQQAVQSGLSVHPLQLRIPGISPAMGAGVQYVLDQAPKELARFPHLTPPMIVQKLDARLGVQNMASNVAAAGSSSPTPQPLAPIPNPSQA